MGVYKMWIFQRPGDLIYIPINTPHLVINLVSNLKVAADHVTAETLFLVALRYAIQHMGDFPSLLREHHENKGFLFHPSKLAFDAFINTF